MRWDTFIRECLLFLLIEELLLAGLCNINFHYRRYDHEALKVADLFNSSAMPQEELFCTEINSSLTSFQVEGTTVQQAQINLEGLV